MKRKVFREYDIRGIVGTEIPYEDVPILGKAFGTYVSRQGKRKIVVGRDCRLSSEKFRDLLVEGLLDAGMDVVDVGVCPTPVFYFAIRHLGREGGIMITASHNPPEYNGFKICIGPDTISGEEILKIKKVMDEGDFVKAKGSYSQHDIIKPYQDFVVNNIQMGSRRLRIAVDAGNATGGPVAIPIFQRLGCEVFPLYCEMDGTFPNHEPDPTVMENLKDLIAIVKKEKLDIGIAYDGDCDRIGVVDQQGNPIYGDKLLIIFAREILSRKPGATIVAEVKCSKVLFDDIAKRGGNPVMWKTGHSLIKAKMKEVNAELAGEMSGHMFFKDRYFGFDDGIYASCRLVEILSKTDANISDLLSDLPPTYNTPEIRVDCPDEIKFEVVKKVQEYLRKKGYNIIDIDGARVVFEDGWGLVRASNTQPVLVLRYEAESPERLEEIRNIVKSFIEKAKKDLA